eukprot:TRINITY_DN429_c0_g1_i2.p1 TRINITY_DN429_c0_g1~~TRINITY_DN429_c0_g1_i2.p1  ORF type:complete len:213 (+),score=82.03 TRINITY_DN429_c0_g1_i2:52-639(+)
MAFFPGLARVKVTGEAAKPNGGMEEFEFRPGYISRDESSLLMDRCLEEVPFGKMRWNMFTLPQKAYLYAEDRKKKPIAVLEQLIAKMQADYGCFVEAVWCNLFETGDHYIDWHQDQYGCHTFVLSFGHPRAIAYRKKKSMFGKEEHLFEKTATHGDIYYFSPVWDQKTEHSVPKMAGVRQPRISLVFFTSRPFTA